MDFNLAAKLHERITAVCPIDGVSVGRKDDKATWRIDFAAGASQPQRVAALAALAAFDVGAAESDDEARAVRSEVLTAQSRSDALIAQLRTASPAEISAFIVMNVNTIADARAMMTRLAIAIAYLLRNE